MSLYGKYYFARRNVTRIDADEAELLHPADIGDVWQPPTDVVELPAGWLVRMELVGVEAGDVQVRVSGTRLTVNGMRRPWCPVARGGRPIFCQVEMRHGLFSRSIVLPAALNARTARACLRDGLLEVTLPRAAEEEPANGDWLVVALAGG